MSRTFAYVRVSTNEQKTENQIQEIKSAGFIVQPHRIITETISGSLPISRRKGFSRLLDKMEEGDVLIVELTPEHTTCKAKDLCGVPEMPETAESGCTPGSGCC